MDGPRSCLFNSIELIEPIELIAPVPRIAYVSQFLSCEIRSPKSAAGDRDAKLQPGRVARSQVIKILTRVRSVALILSMDASITNRRENCKQFPVQPSRRN